MAPVLKIILHILMGHNQDESHHQCRVIKDKLLLTEVSPLRF